ASLWGLEQYRPQFIEWAKRDDQIESETGIAALAALGDDKSLDALLDLAGKEYGEEIRSTAISHLVSRDAKAASMQAVSLLSDLRSEEHTSELQSRENLVCRLLLEKKNNNRNNRISDEEINA